MNRQGRPTEPVAALASAPETFTGNRALRIEEALSFEFGRPEVTTTEDIAALSAALKGRLGR